MGWTSIAGGPERLRAAVAGRLDGALVAAYGFLVVALLAGSSGGYLATSWGWAALATLWLGAVLLLALDEVSLGGLDMLLAGALVAFTGWVAASALWSQSVPSTMREVQRDLAYVGIVATGLVLARARLANRLVGGVFAAIVVLSLYGLGTRLLPDRFGRFDSISYNYRLAPPITYWNGLAIFSVVGIFLALGFAARSRSLVVRALAGATVPLLFATLFFTFSRGGWWALGLALALMVIVDPLRLQLVALMLALAPWTALAIAQAEAREGLTTTGATVIDATRDGHALLPVLLALSFASGAMATVVALVDRTFVVLPALRFAFATALVALAVGGGAWVWTEHGSPVSIAQSAWDSFNDPPQARGKPGDASARLLTLSSNGRINLWRVSINRFEARPVLGDGGGTYWQAWARDRDIPGDSREGHSLYFETLGEMGAVGLALLLVAVLVPVWAGLAARAEPLAPAVLGAYAAWAAHAGIDWDWELPGVTAPALLCGVALVALRREAAASWRPALRGRSALALALVALSIAVVPGLMSELALRDAYRALGDSRTAAALDAARRAKTWAPWSADARRIPADVAAQAGRKREAAALYRAALAHDRSSWPLWQALASVTTGEERARALAQVRRLNPLLG